MTLLNVCPHKISDGRNDCLALKLKPVVSTLPSRLTTISAPHAVRLSCVCPYSGEHSSTTCSTVMGRSMSGSSLVIAMSSAETGIVSPSRVLRPRQE